MGDEWFPHGLDDSKQVSDKIVDQILAGTQPSEIIDHLEAAGMDRGPATALVSFLAGKLSNVRMQGGEVVQVQRRAWGWIAVCILLGALVIAFGLFMLVSG